MHSASMCVCVCVYIYIYIYIYMCVCVYVYICVCVCVCIYIYMCVCVYIYIYIYIYMCVCVCVVTKPINAQKFIKIPYIINAILLQKMFRSLLCSSQSCIDRDGHYKTLQTFVTQRTDVKYEVLNNIWLEIQQIKI